MLFNICKFRVACVTVLISLLPLSQSYAQKAKIKEEEKKIKTYGFSDPNPIPSLAHKSRIYPYFTFEGFSHTAKEQNWKLVTLENDYLEVTVLPEVGGKVYGAIEKSTGEDFIYLNEVMKFRNIASRGPWTSGGIEFNFGIMGHSPATATPVDYILLENEDGSVSCVVGTMDLPSRTQWRVKINLPKDKAYFETHGFWYNPTSIHNSYYNWMTAAARASDDLEFFYPGNHALQHNGESKLWPYDSVGTKVSYYKNNASGGSRSHHMAGSFNNYFGGYFHNKNIGFGHWAPYDEMPGKKLWLWALSRAGGIWEDLLTDNNGQYIEFQAGRLLNQFQPSSSQPTPLTQVAFAPYVSDRWRDVWFPVKNTGGMSSASDLGTIHVERDGSELKFKFNALQKITDDIQVKAGGKTVFKSRLAMNPMELFSTTANVPEGEEKVEILIGTQQIFIADKEDPYKLHRPFVKEKAFKFSEVEQLYDAGKQSFVSRNYARAQEKLEACLALDPGHQSARIRYAELLYRNGLYSQALENVNLALENDFYDAAANYIAGIVYRALNKPVDALEALGWAARSMEYRSAAYTLMAEIHLGMNNLDQAEAYALQALDFNRYNIAAYQTLVVIERNRKNTETAQKYISQILDLDPLNHFARFEKYLLNRKSEALTTFKSLNNNKELKEFATLIRNEMPYQTYLEVAMNYLRLNHDNEALEVLIHSPAHPLVDLWIAYLTRNDVSVSDKYFTAAMKKSPEFVFPFREETIPVLQWANQKNNNWKLKYYLALNLWAKNRKEEAAELFKACGNQPDYAPFYLTRASLLDKSEDYDKKVDYDRAMSLDSNQWRVWHILNRYYDQKKQYKEQLSLMAKAFGKFKGNYVIGMDYAQALLNNKKYDECMKVLGQINVLPYEGAREGRNIYEKVYLLSALEDIRKGKFNEAIIKVKKSLEWPENLGVGEPFEFDKRKQDYLLAYANLKLNRKEEALKYYQGIVAYSMANKDNFSLNHLFGLKALKEQSKLDEIELMVRSMKKAEYDQSPSAKWLIHYWNNDHDNLKLAEKELLDNKDFILVSEILQSTADM